MRGLIKRLLKEDIGLVYVTLGNMGSAVLGAFFWFILATILEVSSYGLVNYYLSLASIFTALGAIGLNTTVIAFLPKGEEEVLYEANSLILISGLILAFSLSIFHWSLGILSATMLFFTMTQAELLSRKMYREYALLSIGARLLQITSSLLLYFHTGLTGIILGYFLGYLAFSYKYFLSLRNLTLKIKSLKEKWSFALHAYGYNLIGKTLPNFLDKIIVGSLFGYYTLGLYQLGFQFFMFLSIISGSLYGYLLPEESSGKSKKELKLVSLIFAVVLALAFYIVSPHIIQTLFPSFADSIPIVQLMSLAVIPSTAVAMLTASLLANGKSRAVFIAGVIYIVSLITGLVIMRSIIGELGLALAFIIAQAIQAIYLGINRKSISRS